MFQLRRRINAELYPTVAGFKYDDFNGAVDPNPLIDATFHDQDLCAVPGSVVAPNRAIDHGDAISELARYTEVLDPRMSSHRAFPGSVTTSNWLCISSTPSISNTTV